MSDLLYLQSPCQKSEIFASPLYTRGPLTRFVYPLHKGAFGGRSKIAPTFTIDRFP